MHTLYCGMDLHSTHCHVGVIDKDGNVLDQKGFATSRENLVEAFSSFEGKLMIHFEASELAGWARTVLLEDVPQAKEVVASDAKSFRWIAQDPQKKDPIDAWKLAEYMRLGRTHPVYYPVDEDIAVFKKTVQHYEDLTDQQAILKQKIKARFRVEGVAAENKILFSQEGRKTALRAVENSFRRQAIAQLYSLLDHALICQEEALELMAEQAERFPVIDRFQAVPGIALRLGCRFVGYVQNPHRFATKQKLWTYSRLGITDRNSNGKPLGYSRLNPNGNGKLKDLSRKAFRAAVLRRKDNNGIKRFYKNSLRRTNDEDNARLNSQRKILETLLIMWKKGTEYDDSYMG